MPLTIDALLPLNYHQQILCLPPPRRPFELQILFQEIQITDNILERVITQDSSISLLKLGNQQKNSYCFITMKMVNKSDINIVYEKPLSAQPCGGPRGNARDRKHICESLTTGISREA